MAYFSILGSSRAIETPTPTSFIEGTQESEPMKITRRLFLTILAASSAINWAPRGAAQAATKACWIVDVTKTTGEADFVDGIPVPNELGIVNYLRQEERKTSQRPCLLGFVTASARITDVDGLRAIAGKIGYEESHVYLYGEQDRGLAREILWTSQESVQAVGKGSRIVDIVITKSGEADYVDGTRVPGDMPLIDYLRRHERTSPHTSLVVFFRAPARIEDVENLRKIAMEIQYENFHPYILDPADHSIATELLYGPPVNLNELRVGPHGPIPLPNSLPAKK
jgi:hypothetical protein